MYLQVFGTGGVGRDEGKVDLRLQNGREFHLRLLRRFLQPLQRLPVPTQVYPVLSGELVGDVVYDAAVKIVAAQKRVAAGGPDLKDPLAHVQDGDVKGAAAQIVDGDEFIPLLAQPVGQGGGRRLVDDAQDVQPGDLPGVLRRLPLAIVEIGRDGDDGLGDRLAQVRLRVGLDFGQNHRRNLRRGVLPSVHPDPDVAVGSRGDPVGDDLQGPLDLRVVKFPAHEALDGKDGVLRIDDGLPFGDLSYQSLPRLRVDGDDGREEPLPLRAGDDDGFSPHHHRADGVGGAQVNANNLTHTDSSQITCPLYVCDSGAQAVSLHTGLAACATKRRPGLPGPRGPPAPARGG